MSETTNSTQNKTTLRQLLEKVEAAINDKVFGPESTGLLHYLRVSLKRDIEAYEAAVETMAALQKEVLDVKNTLKKRFDEIDQTIAGIVDLVGKHIVPKTESVQQDTETAGLETMTAQDNPGPAAPTNPTPSDIADTAPNATPPPPELPPSIVALTRSQSRKKS